MAAYIFTAHRRMLITAAAEEVTRPAVAHASNVPGVMIDCHGQLRELSLMGRCINVSNLWQAIV